MLQNYVCLFVYFLLGLAFITPSVIKVLFTPDRGSYYPVGPRPKPTPPFPEG